MSERIRVRVVYAAATAQYVRDIEVAAGTTVSAAILASGIIAAAGLSEPDLRNVGIFGRSVEHAAVLRDGDRVEIYRGLQVDPKQARRLRAAARRGDS
jgi:putative ubiquitin-RnfH superfamily antitoxin RatB of RatAB toxin-antitoxin module